MPHYCYLFETFDTPAEHINPMGDVIGPLIRKLKDEFDDREVVCRIGGYYHGDLNDGDCCEGYEMPDDFGCDGVMSEDPDRTIYHDPDAWEVFVPDIIDEWWYTVVDVEMER